MYVYINRNVKPRKTHVKYVKISLDRGFEVRFRLRVGHGSIRVPIGSILGCFGFGFEIPCTRSKTIEDLQSFQFRAPTAQAPTTVDSRSDGNADKRCALGILHDIAIVCLYTTQDCARCYPNSFLKKT